MPPGWSHTGEHKTAKMIRKKVMQENDLPQADDEAGNDRTGNTCCINLYMKRF
jgi:hypothetical protein